MCLVVFYFLNRQKVLNKSFGKMKSDNEKICHAKGITKKVPDVNIHLIHLGKINTKVWSLLWEIGHHFEFCFNRILQGISSSVLFVYQVSFSSCFQNMHICVQLLSCFDLPKVIVFQENENKKVQRDTNYSQSSSFQSPSTEPCLFDSENGSLISKRGSSSIILKLLYN